MSTKKPNKRQTHFIDPEVQGALSRRIVLQWVLFTAVSALMAFALTWMGDPFVPVQDVLVETWWRYAPLLLVLVCMLPIFVMDTIKLSNRFTGPVYRLRQVARKLAAGERPEKVEFRGGDFWRGLADDMNLVIKRVAEVEDARQADSEAQPAGGA